ncbi:MAG: beta-lactamase family protein [Gemmatimonadaceae bacterium]|nr:beta-lactamase family protein [Chitinophagaceae bacterium]
MQVYKDGKPVYTKQTNKEFTLKTQAPIGSASSWLTAALVMTFVKEGKISLDDPIAKYIPIFEAYSKRYITIRNCLAHTTGIKADAPTAKGMTKSRFSSLEEEVISYAKREIEKNPGQMVFFSEVGPNIAGRICEVVGKKAFDRLMQERILRPLKMRGTNFYIDYSQAMNPFGGAVSTAIDLGNFLTMMLNQGRFETKEVLTPELIAEMQKIQTGNAPVKYMPKLAQGLDFGFGLWVLEKDSKGKATAVASPGIFGAWPMIDYCRGYAAFLLPKSMLGEQRSELYISIREAVNGQFQCKSE